MADSLYVNIMALPEKDLKDPWLKVFPEAYHSKETAEFIKTQFPNSIYLVWKEQAEKKSGKGNKIFNERWQISDAPSFQIWSTKSAGAGAFLCNETSVFKNKSLISQIPSMIVLKKSI